MLNEKVAPFEALFGALEHITKASWPYNTTYMPYVKYVVSQAHH